MSDRALSRAAFWVMLLIHCVAGFVLFAVLVGFVPKFERLFEQLRERGELPAVTVFVLAFTWALSKYGYCLLLFGFGLDAAVLFASGRLAPKLRWLSTAWFSSPLKKAKNHQTHAALSCGRIRKWNSAW
jgi:type II secretory pathway component PulF